MVEAVLMPPSGSPSKAVERRRSPRFRVESQPHQCLQLFDTPVILYDLSAGGFAAHCPVPMSEGSVYPFEVRDADGLAGRLFAVARFSREDPRGSGYVVGFQFASDDGPHASARQMLRDRLVLQPQVRLSA